MSIGVSRQKIDAVEKVRGEALYPGDISFEDLLFAKSIFSGHPHARMLSMDCGEALQVDGVVAIYTAADVPVNEHGLVIFDQPVMVGLNSDKPESDISKWEGDRVAMVVAESEAAAALAGSLIKIEWETLPILDDVETAMTSDTIIHRQHGSNVLKDIRFGKEI